jgi:hypothetical protein
MLNPISIFEFPWYKHPNGTGSSALFMPTDEHRHLAPLFVPRCLDR